MLPKSNRLVRKKDFEKVFQKGRSFKENGLFLKKNQNNLDVSRFGFIISTKVSKKAVIRNKLKRRLREIVQRQLPDISPGFDVILVVNRELLRQDFKELENLVVKLFRASHLLNS